MTKPFDIPPPGGYDATPEQRDAATEQMRRDADRLNGSRLAAEMARIADKTRATKAGQGQIEGGIVQ